ncbi:hypothetical protein ACFLWX_00140 [Chloroflexota bacterium]
MADAMALERRGIPVAMIGIEKLVITTGKAMARAHGMIDYPVAVVSHAMGPIEDLKNGKGVKSIAEPVVEQVADILIG